jgi:SulP family sulfate permease
MNDLREGSTNGRVIFRIVPIAGLLRSYSTATVRADVVAGIALAGLLVPEGMAYAGIAGVPPEAGLYSAAMGLFVYAIFGSSRQLAVSPTSGSAAMLAAFVGPLAMGSADRYAALASATAIAAGILLLIAGFFKLGFVSEFISKPVLKGFVFGIAITIMVKQAPKLIGIEKGPGNVFSQAWHIVTSFGQANPWTLAVGLCALAGTFLLAKFLPRIPSALVVLVLGILAVTLFGLDRRGVEIVGGIRAGMPVFGLPSVTADDLGDLFAGALGIVLIVYAEALAAGRTFASKFNYEIDPNQELAAIGASNVASGLAQGFIVGGGMSGTAANAAGGARTQIASFVTSLAAVLTLLFLMPLFHNLPEAVLGAIVIHAVWHLADVRELRRFAKLKTGSIWIALAAMAGVLALSVLKGLILAVCLTLIALMRRISAPQVLVLGRLPVSGAFVDVANYPEAEPVPGILILRPSGPLFFANANRVHGCLRELVQQAAGPVREMILVLEASHLIDITTLDMLQELKGELDARGVGLSLAKVSAPTLDLFRLSGFLARLGDGRIFSGVKNAVEAFPSDRP